MWECNYPIQANPYVGEAIDLNEMERRNERTRKCGTLKQEERNQCSCSGIQPNR
jgi:hypothetical protein